MICLILIVSCIVRAKNAMPSRQMERYFYHDIGRSSARSAIGSYPETKKAPPLCRLYRTAPELKCFRHRRRRCADVLEQRGVLGEARALGEVHRHFALPVIQRRQQRRYGGSSAPYGFLGDRATRQSAQGSSHGRPVFHLLSLELERGAAAHDCDFANRDMQGRNLDALNRCFLCDNWRARRHQGNNNSDRKRPHDPHFVFWGWLGVGVRALCVQNAMERLRNRLSVNAGDNESSCNYWVFWKPCGFAVTLVHDC